MIVRSVVIAFLLNHAGACATTSSPGDTAERRISAVKSEIQALFVQWTERDGELRYLISDRLAMALIANPMEFVSVMSSHPTVSRDWVKNVGGASLRDYGDPLINRQVLRQEMMKAALRAAPSSPREIELRDMLLKKLEDTPVTVVD
jgi:hypothetical protein